MQLILRLQALSLDDEQILRALVVQTDQRSRLAVTQAYSELIAKRVESPSIQFSPVVRHSENRYKLISAE